MDLEAPSIDMDPYKFKLLSRLYYYQRNLLSILGVRATLIIALINRINIISILEDYMPVNHILLYKGNGSALEFNINSYSNKSQITSKGVIGIVYPVDGDRVLFIGFTEDILICRIGQKELENFKELNLDFDKYK
ncbi:hypothetical protein, partial [Metabacillus fastidiosus]